MSDIEGGMFGDKEYFKPLVDSISNMKVGNDWFLVANDFASYLDAQAEVDKVREQEAICGGTSCDRLSCYCRHCKLGCLSMQPLKSVLA